MLKNFIWEFLEKEDSPTETLNNTVEENAGYKFNNKK